MAEWSGAERRGGDGGRPRGGSESPDRRLQPSVGPRRASAPVSGSVGAGCRPSVLPGGQPGWWRAAARAWERGGGRLRAVYALRGLSGPAEPAPPCTELRGPRPAPLACAGARPSQPGRQDHPAVSGLPFVVALRTFVI